MNMRWDLSDLYSGFDAAEFDQDVTILEALIKDYSAELSESSFSEHDKKLEMLLKLRTEIGLKLSKLSEFSELSFSVDTSDNTAVFFIEQFDEKRREFEVIDVGFTEYLTKIGASDVMHIISSSTELSDYHFHIKELIQQAENKLSPEMEKIVADFQATGSSAWSKLHSIETSTLTAAIEKDGKKEDVPFSIIRSMAYSKDSDLRKKAYKAELKACSQITNVCASCLNGVKGEAITISKLRGYESLIDMTLKQSRMKKETLDIMMETVREYLPKFREYYRKKAKMLEYKGGLPFYDLFAPVNDSQMLFNYSEAQDFIVDNFGKFSEDLSSFARNAFDNRWVDAKPAKGKVGGAFCANLRSIGQSRILANFNGSFNDVRTIAHELGHAFHGHCLKDVAYLNSHYPMPLAETASIFCETIISHAALERADRDQAVSILEADISSAGQVIVDIYSRFLFEAEVVRRREKGSLSVDNLNQIMIDAQKEAYGDGLDPDFYHKYMWVVKPHYYFPKRHFYNFPYTFGLLFAKGIFAIYQEKGEGFVHEYEKLLANTGMMSIEDVAGSIGLDLSQGRFWKGSLDVIAEDIEKFLKL